MSVESHAHPPDGRRTGPEAARAGPAARKAEGALARGAGVMGREEGGEAVQPGGGDGGGGLVRRPGGRGGAARAARAVRGGERQREVGRIRGDPQRVHSRAEPEEGGRGRERRGVSKSLSSISLSDITKHSPVQLNLKTHMKGIDVLIRQR